MAAYKRIKELTHGISELVDLYVFILRKPIETKYNEYDFEIFLKVFKNKEEERDFHKSKNPRDQTIVVIDQFELHQNVKKCVFANISDAVLVSDMKECSYYKCSKVKDKTAYLKTHFSSHLDYRQYICPAEGCLKQFKQRNHMKYHAKNVHKICS